MDSFNDVFQEVLKYCRNCKSISEPGYNKWIKILEPMKLENNVAYLLTDSDFSRDITMNAYENLLKEAFLNTLGFEVDIKILVKDKEEVNETEEKDIEVKVADFSDEENNNLTFDNFIKGKSNDLAYAFSTAVAHKYDEDQKTPSNTNTIFNPLIIYGDSGLGKTHLMKAIEHEVKKNHPELKIIYTTGESFINQLVKAIESKETNKFHDKYRNADYLMVDDIQTIAGKERMQEEFFHTFNALHSANKQIIISSDRPPKDMETLEARLQSRFEWGLIADISSPDYETRMAILRKKEELDGYNIDDEVIRYIATNIKSNIRELEGALNKLVALSNLENREITISMAEEVLKDIISPNSKREVTPQVILDVVAEHYGVSSNDIIGGKRNSEIVVPRQIVMYLCREITDTSYKAIGILLGNRDHSTIISGDNKVRDKLAAGDTSLKSNIDTIRKKLSSG